MVEAADLPRTQQPLTTHSRRQSGARHRFHRKAIHCLSPSAGQAKQPPPSHLTDRTLLYLGMTRAEDVLVVLHSGRSKLVDEIQLALSGQNATSA